MKSNKVIRKFTVLLAALVLMGGFSVTAYAGAVSYTHLTLPTNREVSISVGAGSLKKKKNEHTRQAKTAITNIHH